MKWSVLILGLAVALNSAMVANANFLFNRNSAQAKVEKLRCEYLNDPIGIESVKPRLSWIIDSDKRGESQAAYEILVASSPGMLRRGQGDLWDTGKVPSDQTTQIVYQGLPLGSREDCYWKVRIWDQHGRSRWSDISHWKMGLLKPEDWSAEWISAPAKVNATGDLQIKRAIYEAINGGGSNDVTALIEQNITNGSVSMVIKNDTFGADPAQNQHKHLIVDYEWQGKTNTVTVGEEETLTLPPEAAALPYFRKSFNVDGPVKRAVLYVTALGLYEVDINGHRVGDHVFAPDWTDYRKRVRYQAYDVTALLRSGGNAIGGLLANGWYSGHIGNGGFQLFGKVPALLVQLEVTHADGSVTRVVTDDSWKSHPSPILASDIMMGETYDARKELKGWDLPAFDDRQWNPVLVRDEPSIILDSQVMPPVRELLELSPKKETEPQTGHWTYDLGQNMVGVARLRVSAPAGTKVTVRYAEMLNPDGTIYTNNLRGARAVDEYICKGTGTQIWQPRFTFHGFRYIEISGLDTDPGMDAVKGIVIGSDSPPAGKFACSDPRVNQLFSNIQWGQRGNYFSVPTDCPQRDERMGWMGDAEVFVRTATYNADVASFFTKWLMDVEDGRSQAGAFSDVSPNDHLGQVGAPGWGDAGVICPWTIYEVYGDKRILKRHLHSMIQWVEFLRAHSDGLIRDRDRGNDYGDWLSINADTPKDLIGTAYFAYSTHLVAKSCLAVGDADDAAKYEKLFEDIKAAFDKRYVSPDGRVYGDTQTAYVLALRFDLLPAELRPKAAQYLVDDIEKRGWHLSTGFLGVGNLLPVLAQDYNADAAYRLLLQDTYPSWLFPVKHGATTIWERWDGWTPDKGFQDPEMNSFNHYSLGSCGEFLYGDVGGIRPDSAGYKTILIDPVPGAGLTWAKTSYDSIHGLIATYWKLDGNRFSLRVTVPANTTATVCLPATDAAAVTESGKLLGQDQAVSLIKQENGKVYVGIGSGTYQFTSQVNPVYLANDTSIPRAETE